MRPLLQTARVAVGDLVRGWKPMLAVDVIFAAIAFVILAPLSGLALRGFLTVSGDAVLADTDIFFFLLSPVGVLATLVLGSVSLTIVALQQASLMTVALGVSGNSAVSVPAALTFAFRHAGDVMRVALRVLTVVLVTLTPFLAGAGAVYWGLLTEFDINFYLTERPASFWAAAAALLVLSLGLAGVLVPRLLSWTYALPILLFEDIRADEALAESARSARGHRGTLAAVFGGWLVAATGAGWLVLGLVATLGRWLVPLMEGSVAVLVVLLGALVMLWALANLAVAFLQASSFSTLVVRLYEDLGRSQALSNGPWERLGPGAPPKLDRRLTPGGAGVLLLVVTALAATAGAVLLRSVRVEDEVVVIAHRGASRHAPENTLAAVERAIDDGADYVEIDVQETADGEVVVIHDADLMKVGGSPLRVAQATAEELRQVDVGSRFGPEFAGERLPTLEEVLERCRGRARVNIELKFYGEEERLEEGVIDIVERLDMSDAIVTMSLKYDAVEEMRTLRPEWRSGLLTARAVGDLARREVDFFAVNGALATRAFIRSAHTRDRDVYVWTVNDPVDMWHYISRGVDGLITDDPALARRVLEERAGLGSAERLLLSLALFLGDPLEPPSAESEA